MTLTALAELSNESRFLGSGDANVTSLQADSRAVAPGALFVAMPGMSTDTHGYLPSAVAAGAVAAIVHSSDGLEFAKSLGLAVIQLPTDKAEFGRAIWRFCDTFFDHPTRRMQVIGVTGTNGKTTTAWLLRDILTATGLTAGYLGTLGFQIPGLEAEVENTTPLVVELYNLLAVARDRGVEALAMEVSSHALADQRAEGVEFDAAVFTNLTQDHLDFHGTMEAYELAKWRLFTELPRFSSKSFRAAINADDPVGARWIEQSKHEIVPYSMQFLTNSKMVRLFPSSIRVDSMDLSPARWSTATSEYDRDERATVRVPLGGNYNHANLTSAFAGALALGFSEDAIWSALPHVRPVPGRFEAVPNTKGFGVLVDYAHTPDALEKLLDAVRPLTSGRIITVFGCGGDRDKTKRPKMARAASLRSDVTVVTSDNPRTEDPSSILDEVMTGIIPGRESVSIVDRKEAVAHAIGLARPGDVVVLAGKGHENYQIIGKSKVPMGDRELAREALG